MIEDFRITVCIIYYDNFDEIISFLANLDNQNSEQIVVGITVNKDTKKKAKELKKSYFTKKMTIHLFFPETNIGYLNGLFYAYEGLAKKNNDSQWITFCNTDVELPDNNFFDKFFKNKYPKDIYCVAPSVFEKNRKVFENPQYEKRYNQEYLNKRIFIFERPILAKIYINLSKVKSLLSRNKKKDSRYVYSAHGSFFILRNSFLQSINRNYFSLMYSEEAFVAEEIRLLEKKVYYDSSLEVIHNENQSTGKLNFEKKSRYIAESLIKIRDRYFI